MAHTSDVFDITTNNEETDADRLLSEFHKRFGGYTAAEAAAFAAGDSADRLGLVGRDYRQNGVGEGESIRTGVKPGLDFRKE